MAVLPTGGGPDRTAPVFVPKGSTVAWSVYAMHRRPDFYGLDAELFRPERWDEDMPIRRDKTNAAWGYLPFNGGPRTCLGRKSICSQLPSPPSPYPYRQKIRGAQDADFSLFFLLQRISPSPKPPTPSSDSFTGSLTCSYRQDRR